MADYRTYADIPASEIVQNLVALLWVPVENLDELADGGLSRTHAQALRIGLDSAVEWLDANDYEIPEVEHG